MHWQPPSGGEDLSLPQQGLFIVNEGNFQYGNATLSFYDPATGIIQNEVFARANGMRLGDVAQSMTIHNGLGWIVVNNSHAIFAVDTQTLREKGRITGLTSPRYMHFVSDDKAYVSQLWDNRIFIVDPRRFSVIGTITVPDMISESGSTEQMVQSGDFVFCNCHSYQNRIIKIDTRTDRVVAALEVGLQPACLAIDVNGKLWTVCDGGYPGSPTGNEPPTLLRIRPADFAIEKRWTLTGTNTPGKLAMNAAGDTVYWISDDIWRMKVNDNDLPRTPFVKTLNTKYYALTVSPFNSDVYIADAIDYQQHGIIRRYNSNGDLVASFDTGIIPAAFCWQKTQQRHSLTTTRKNKPDNIHNKP